MTEGNPAARLVALNDLVGEIVRRTSAGLANQDTAPLTWEEKVAVLQLASVKVLIAEAPISGRRGKVIQAATADYARKLQAYLPLTH